MRWPRFGLSQLSGVTSTRSVASFSVVSIAAASLVFAAVSSEGYRTTSTDLHDGTVWTLSVDRAAIARVNARINEFDTVVRSDVADANLYQSGTSVYLQTPEGFSQLNSIGTNVSKVEFTELPPGSQIGVSGGTAAVLAPDGQLWVRPAQALSAIAPEDPPLLEVNAGSRLAVTPGGEAVVLDPVDDTFTVVRNLVSTADDTEGQFEVSEPEPFGHDVPEPGASTGDFELTAVGPTAVALLDGEILLPGAEPITIVGAGDQLVLQQPGIAADGVVVADPSGLYKVSLGSGEITELVSDGSGPPAAPAVVGNCVYAGWEAVDLVWKRCGNEPAVTPKAVGEDLAANAGTNWIFRVNRDQVVLEAQGVDPKRITDDGLVAIDNWQDFDNNDEQKDDQQTEQQPDQKEQAVCQDADATPEANNDEFGATPGVALVLRVLDNDRDPNCDPIAIKPLAEGVWNAAWGTIALIDQNQAFQYTPPTEPVAVSFPYIIDDGRGGEATATVTINVSNGENGPPILKPGRVSETIVEMFKTVSYNVLLDWADPNGDTLLLETAVLSPGDGAIIWSKDGTITYTASDTVAGPKEIAITVGDGFGNLVEGTLNVSVQGEGVPLPPTARDDYVQLPAGREVIVEPLANDTDPNNDPLVLGEYDRIEGDAVMISQGEQGSLRLSSQTPGTYLIGYDVTDGALKDTATIRVEVTPPDQPQRPPVPVRDSVVLKVGRSLNVDVLANDYDADGDVLLVTDARLQQVGLAGIDVDVIDRRNVRVQVDQDPGQPLVIEYLVSDGFNPEQLGQLVVNVAPATGNQRPVAGNDEVRVRVNDVIDIPVLSNDVDPDGDKINILSASLDPETQPGVLWLDGQKVRYRAGSEAGTIKASYTIDDTPDRSGLNASSGFVEITVVDSPPEKNSPPTPPPLEARVFAGSTVNIPIPTIGMDPDGDSVTLVEIGDAPPPLSLPAQLGVPTVSRNAIVYTANTGASGQDTFTYEVEDAFGARSVAVVRVAVVVAPNHPPALVPDAVVARPGRFLQVPVLSNDSDPDGDALSLVDISGVPDDLDAVVNDGRVQITLPDTAGDWQLYYSATDGKGPAVQQVLTISADPAAPLLPAVARDDPAADVVLEPAQGPDGTYTVTLDVLTNDDDPDGARSELVVDVPVGQDALAVVTPGSGNMTVTLTDRPQSFVYRVSDFDGNESYAVVRVPRAPGPEEEANRSPILRTDPIVVTITQGEPGEVRVADYVVDPDGDDVQLAGEQPSSPQGEALVSDGNFDSFVFTPALELPQTEATIFVAVTDRPGEPEFTVELPFTVIVEKPNQPPVVQATELKVEQLGEAAPIDLVAAGVVADPEDDSVVFALTGGGIDGLSVKLSPDGIVTAQADGVAEGATTTYNYTVTDGQPDRVPVVGAFTVRSVASTKPLVVLKPIRRNDIKQGQAEKVDVLQGVANPFPDIPLKVIDAQLVNGEGAVTFDGTSVTFTPPDSYFGTVEVRYTVEDGTSNAARHATGTVGYTVIGRPLAPGQPRVVEVYSHTAVVEWAPADPQGSPVTDYTVSWAGGSIQSKGATTVTIASLTNNTPYTFKVTATNAVGTSEPSAPSGEIIPDQLPPKPSAPRVVSFGDGTLNVEWDKVVPDGSPVILYHLTLSGGATQTFPGSQLSTTWIGLTNGTEYTFSLVAENNEGRSDVSGLSNALSPAREPAAPAKPTVTDVGNALVAEVLVQWPVPANNGRPIDFYEITAVATGQTYTSLTNQIRVQLPAGQNSTFTVRAHNVVNFSLPSPASNQFESIIAPTAVGEIRGLAQDSAVWLRVALVSSSDGGDPIVRYEWSRDGGAFQYIGAIDPSSPTSYLSYGGLTNGTGYSFAGRACNKKFCGPASPTISGLVPFGPPRAAYVSVSGTRGAWNGSSYPVTWNWSTNGAYNGKPLTITVSGPQVSSSAANGPVSTTYGPSTGDVTVTIRVSDGTVANDVVKFALVNIPAAPPPPGYNETTGVVTNTWSNYLNAGGTSGGQIPRYQTVQISCRLTGFAVANGNTNWYRIASSPWTGFYASADAFYNNGATSGSLAGTPWVDPNVPLC